MKETDILPNLAEYCKQHPGKEMILSDQQGTLFLRYEEDTWKTQSQSQKQQTR